MSGKGVLSELKFAVQPGLHTGKHSTFFLKVEIFGTMSSEGTKALYALPMLTVLHCLYYAYCTMLTII